MSRSALPLATIAIAAACAIPSGHAAPLYTIEDLGVLAGDDNSNARAINNNRQVTGTSRIGNGDDDEKTDEAKPAEEPSP